MSAIGGHHSHRAGTETWLTPPDIIAALGPFDLDPCAAPSPRPWPTAAKHIELPEDGLTAQWSGFVWCNPPYGRAVAAWLARMNEHGDGLALIFARTETEAFFQQVWRGATATGVLFIEARLHFHFPDGRRAPANSGGPSALVAYGDRALARLAEGRVPGALTTWRVKP